MSSKKTASLLRKLGLSVFFLVALENAPAFAGDLNKELAGLDPKSVCPADSTGPISKGHLARAIVQAYKIPYAFVDWNDTGITSRDYIRVVTVPYCIAGADDPAHKDLCWKKDGTPTDENTLQVTMANEVMNAINDVKASNGDFDLTLAKFSIHFHRLRQPTPVEIQRMPELEDPLEGATTQAFSEDPALYSLECMPKAGAVAEAQDQKPGLDKLIENFRLRSKAEDLAIDRGDKDKFAGLNPASLAVVDDRISKKETVDVHAVLGYAFPTWHPDGMYFQTIPFAKYDRDYVDAKKTPKGSNIHNLAFGLLESFTFPTFGDRYFYSNLAVQPLYLHSFRDDSDQFKLLLRLTPEPDIGVLGHRWNPGDGDISVTGYVRAAANISWVLDTGTNLNLATTSNYVQGGFQIGGSIFDSKEGSWLNGFSMPVEYTYLHGFSGPYDDVRLFSIALNYTFPKTKYISIGLSYSDGENLDTFAKQKIEKLTLGIKY